MKIEVRDLLEHCPDGVYVFYTAVIELYFHSVTEKYETWKCDALTVFLHPLVCCAAWEQSLTVQSILVGNIRKKYFLGLSENTRT